MPITDWLTAQEQQGFEALLAAGYQEMSEQSAALVEEMMPLQMAATAATWRRDE